MRKSCFDFRFMVGLLAVVAGLSLTSQLAVADNVYATIRGYVTDATGAILPGVQVTATNTQTGVTSTITSQDNGRYEFVQLPIGTYSVSATKQGFKTYKSTAFTLAVNQVYDLPVAMQVGTVNETVEVKAEAIQVDSTTIQQNTVIGAQQITDLPLIGRNFTQLEQLAPGVMASNDRFGTFSVNGSQTQQSSYLVNGTDTNDIALNTPGILPSPDAIQEFNLISSTINPEYGRNSGGIVNALIKSGTNSFHGDAFDFYRDTFLNTRNFFTVGPQQPIFHQNTFGGTIGGPIWKDKTFFFLSYQGTRNATGSATVDTVLSNAERSGNLAEAFFDGSAQAARMLRNTATTPVPLVGDDGVLHPAGTHWMGSGTTGAIFNCGAAVPASGSLAAFSCPNANFAHIATSNFNSISKGLLNNFVPTTNAPGNQFGFSAFNTQVVDQGIARVDHNLTASDLLWGVAILQQNNQTNGLPFTGATLPGFGTHSTAGTKNFTISENHTFNNSTLNELRLGYWRLNFDAVEPNQVISPSSFGFTNITPQNPAAAQMPVVAVTGFFTLGYSDNGPQPRIDENYQLTDNFSKIIGRHSLKFGFDARRFQVNNPFNARVDGHYDFSGSGHFTTRNPALDFLFGVPTDYVQTAGGFINARAYEYYGYGQDQWKIRNNLTLTFGAGYQVDTPYNNNQFGGEAFNCVIPGQQSTIFPTAPVGLNYPGDTNCTRSGTTTKLGHIGPRFGFAWSPDLGKISGGGTGKFAIRGGFGVYFNRYEEETALQNLGAPPFGLSSLGAFGLGGSPSFANPFQDIANRPGLSTTNPFPFTPPPPGTPINFSVFEPMVLNTNSPTLSTPYAMNFNLNIQREFSGNTVVSLGYIGSMGRHLYRAEEANPNPLKNPAFPAPPLNPAIFSSVGTQFTDGTSNYNSMQLNVTKGLTHGLSFITSYTWSRSIDNGSGFENSAFGTRGVNPFVPGANVGDSAQDARQRFVMGYIYQIPSLHHMVNALPDRIFGGWKLTGITTFQTGFPFNISDSAPTSQTCNAGAVFYDCYEIPNQVVGNVITLDPRTSFFNNKGDYWFDPTSYAPAAAGTFGNTHRSSLHGPGLNNWDFSLQKDTKITERTSFEIGMEAFNLFNHTQFGNPASGNVESGSFGRILSAAQGRLVQLRAKVFF